jgi:homoserine dehydrogenase
MKQIQVGIIGFGTVGSGLAQTLYEQKDRLRRKVGTDVVLTQVADIMTDSLPEQFAGVKLTKDAKDLFTNPDIDIVVELIGGM